MKREAADYKFYFDSLKKSNDFCANYLEDIVFKLN